MSHACFMFTHSQRYLWLYLAFYAQFVYYIPRNVSNFTRSPMAQSATRFLDHLAFLSWVWDLLRCLGMTLPVHETYNYTGMCSDQELNLGRLCGGPDWYSKDCFKFHVECKYYFRFLCKMSAVHPAFLFIVYVLCTQI